MPEYRGIARGFDDWIGYIGSKLISQSSIK